MSFFDRLAGLFGSTSKPQHPPPPRQRPETPRVAAAPKVVESAGPPQSVFDRLLEMLGSERPAGVELTPEAQEAEAKLVASVREHFAANRPAPNPSQALSLRVINMVAARDFSIIELTKLISQDPAVTAEMLKVANSPAYRGTQEVETLRDAVMRLGAQEVGRIAGSVAARTLFGPQLRKDLAHINQKLNQTSEESAAVAKVAAGLAMRVKGARTDLAFLGGMLHDVGRSVALSSLAAVVPAGVRLSDSTLDRVVEQVHVELGAETHKAWELPRFLTLVALRHHEQDLPADGELLDVHVVRLVSALVQWRRHPELFDRTRAEVDSSARALGVDAFALRSLDTEVRLALGMPASPDKARAAHG